MKFVETILEPIKWLGQVVCEPDEATRKGKASFTRVAGAVVIAFILRSGELGRAIPKEWMIMFWVLVGSKVVNSLSPGVLDLCRAYLLKTGAVVNIPAANPPAPEPPK